MPRFRVHFGAQAEPRITFGPLFVVGLYMYVMLVDVADQGSGGTVEGMA